MGQGFKKDSLNTVRPKIFKKRNDPSIIIGPFFPVSKCSTLLSRLTKEDRNKILLLVSECTNKRGFGDYFMNTMMEIESGYEIKDTGKREKRYLRFGPKTYEKSKLLRNRHKDLPRNLWKDIELQGTLLKNGVKIYLNPEDMTTFSPKCLFRSVNDFYRLLPGVKVRFAMDERLSSSIVYYYMRKEIEEKLKELPKD